MFVDDDVIGSVSNVPSPSPSAAYSQSGFPLAVLDAAVTECFMYLL